MTATLIIADPEIAECSRCCRPIIQVQGRWTAGDGTAWCRAGQSRRVTGHQPRIPDADVTRAVTVLHRATRTPAPADPRARRMAGQAYAELAAAIDDYYGLTYGTLSWDQYRADLGDDYDDPAGVAAWFASEAAAMAADRLTAVLAMCRPRPGRRVARIRVVIRRACHRTAAVLSDPARDGPW
jgi:hypothetical protein